jgi:hypothetical protein
MFGTLEAGVVVVVAEIPQLVRADGLEAWWAGLQLVASMRRAHWRRRRW